MLAGFFLELGHTVQPANAGNAIKDPGQSHMSGHLALVKDDMIFWVDTGCKISCRDFARISV